ncbi:hypothetical protein [Zavarzinella formosa]|uniref:hypothetical protein n=1 Tax=Zavarzinella formosa TaxID=360055 RepID=UPI0002DC3B85|nr:hypothetical protein [Zavarzinella formosa]
MSDPLQPVSPGDPIPDRRAAMWNQVFSSARHFRTHGVGRSGAPAVVNDPLIGNLEIIVRNDTGATLLEMAVLKLGDPLVSVVDYPIDNQEEPAFAGLAPTGPADLVCVTQQGLSTGEIGRATIAGICVCKINVTDASHGYASPTATSSAYLLSGVTGFHRILWKESGTGVKMAVVMMELSPNPQIPDTAHDVSGIINLLGQHLGNGSKGVDSLWVGLYDRSDGALFTNSSGALWVTGKTAGLPNSGELQTGSFTSIVSGVGASAQIKAYTDGSKYGWNFLTNGGTGGSYASIFTAVYGASGTSLLSTDNLSLSQNCHARTYSVKYGILTFAGDSSIGFDPVSGANQTFGLNFVHGLYTGGDLAISFADISGTLSGSKISGGTITGGVISGGTW